jgi:hypothetical protein
MNNFPQMQDLSGLTPVFQNISSQQQALQQAMQQGNQLANQAMGSQQGGGLDPKALAQALRKDNPMLSKEQNAEIYKLIGLWLNDSP